MKRKLILFFALFCGFTAFGQINNYLAFDETCMDRYVYGLKGSSANPKYISYRLPISDYAFVTFDIGAEYGNPTKSIPRGTMNCQGYPMTMQTIREINNGDRKLFIVRPYNGGYLTAEVKKASYQAVNRNVISYEGHDVNFDLDINRPEYNKNLASSDSENVAFLSGVDFVQCEKGYIIRKASSMNDKNYKEFTLLPKIGVLEKRSVILAKNNTQVNVIALETINKKDVDDYIGMACTKAQAASLANKGQTVPTSYAGTSGRITAAPMLAAKGAPCPTVSREGYHVVKTGETLYAISRRYGISLDQLRGWNNMQNSNILVPCQELKVASYAAPTTTTSPRPSTNNNNNNNRDEYPAVITSPSDSNPYAGNTTTVRSTYDRTFNEANKPAWVTNQGYHIVAAGETAAYIANKYGFTEERFRYMNGLGEREKLYTGQTLRITICEKDKSQGNLGQPQPYNFVARSVEDVVTQPVPQGGTTVSTLAPAAATSSPNGTYGTDFRVHIVQNGENLFSIAQDYGTTVERLREINNLSAGEIILQSQRIYVDK